jgi:hypothetical protein
MLLALVLSASLGAGAFAVDDMATTAEYTQQADSLTLTAPVAFGNTLGGVFSGTLDWNSVDRIFLEAATDGENPDIFFAVELLGWDGSAWQLINAYSADTAGLTTSFGLLELQLSTRGSGDFSNFRGLQFTSNSLPLGAGGLIIRSVVGSTGPIEPVVTSTSYAGGDFTMTWSGTGVIPVIVQRREALESGQWTAIAQGIASGTYTDTDPPTGKAFYRVVVP